MKRFKSNIISFIAGALCILLTTGVVAASKNVTAVLTPDVFFNVDGKVVAPESDMPVINYNDRVYVPIRQVSKLLGASVDWDIVKRQVVLTSPEPEVVTKEVIKEVEKIVYVKDDSEASKTYSTMPVYKETNDYKLSVTSVEALENATTTKVYFNLENKSTNNWQLDQTQSSVTIDGESFKMSKNTNLWDKSWYSDVGSGDSSSGYIILDGNAYEWDYMTVSVVLRPNGVANAKDETVTLYVKRLAS